MEVYYCGFNGFKQVPSSADCDTLTCLTVANKSGSVPGKAVVDVAICWNYLVVADSEGITKYGLVNNKPSLQRLEPPSSEGIRQVSATPRYILTVTDRGHCWTNEEGKGWRRIVVSSESNAEEESGEGEAGEVEGDGESSVEFVSTACGDYHNLAVDRTGLAYSLPSQLSVPGSLGMGPPRVSQVVCGKEHCMLLTEHGQVYTWGGGSRGQLGHGTLTGEDQPRLVMALDGVRITKIAAGGWHSAAISQSHDLYMFGWNESGQLAQQTNLARPAECFSAVEKLLMACCTGGIAEGAALPRGDTEDTEVYRKHDPEKDKCPPPIPEPEKETLSCYTGSSCDTPSDIVTLQPTPMLVSIGGKTEAECAVVDVSCGSRHTVCLTKGDVLWAFGWNKYGQLGTGDTKSRDSVVRMILPNKTKHKKFVMLRCGDWGTAIVTE